MRTEAIVWGCLAVGLVALEVMAPGVFMLWLGVAAGAVLVLVLVFPGKIPLLWQAVVFAVASMALVPLYRHFLGSRHVASDRPLLNKRSEQLIGQVFLLQAAIVSGRGRIKVGDALWTVTGPELPAGTRVRVTGADAMTLQVMPE
jgi:membrane protein implicated in regulation of membrane protease activity